MRIAFVSTILAYPWGGADTLWTRAAEAASARGDALFISVSPQVANSSRIAALFARGAVRHERTSPPPDHSLKTRIIRKLRLAPAPDSGLIAALADFRPERVIFSQGGTYDLLLHPALVRWLKSAGVKYQVIANWQHEAPELAPGQSEFIRDAFAAAEMLNFVSTRNLATTRRHLGAALPNARVLHNPLRWQTSDVTPWPALPALRLATVSRLDEIKGIHLLLEALAAALPSLAPWELTIFGQGPAEPHLRQLTAKLKLSERVQFRGYERSLRTIWESNHLLVSPAIAEGVPMTIPEAMLCERPVLATSVGGAEDWLVHGRTGFLCEKPAVETLAAALIATFAERSRWPAIGQAAAAAARDRYRAIDHLSLIAA